MCALFGNAGMMGFVYYFPRLDRPKEAKIVIPLSIFIITLAYFEFVFTGYGMEKIYNFKAHFYTFDYGAKHAVILC